MRRLLPCTLALPCFALTPACDAPDGSSDDAADARDDAFISGKADGGLEPAELSGVLSVVNTLDFETLDISVRDGGVGLDRRAAQGIIDLRAGDDGTLETEDDERFETLAQLDAVPYVGPVALERLLDFAYDQGFVTLEPEGLPLEALLGSWSLSSPGTATYSYEHWTGPSAGATGSSHLFWHAEVEVFEDVEGRPSADVRCWVSEEESGDGYIYDEVSASLPLDLDGETWAVESATCESNPYHSPRQHCARCSVSFESGAEGTPVMRADFSKDSFTLGIGVSWQPTVHRWYSYVSRTGLRR